MDSFNNLFRKAAFGGFNREDDINYIEKIKNEFFDYKKEAQNTINELNETVKELKKELESKNQAEVCVKEETAEIDFSASVTEMNKAADRLRETADKVCDDIGDFLDRVLKTDKVSDENVEENASLFESFIFEESESAKADDTPIIEFAPDEKAAAEETTVEKAAVEAKAGEEMPSISFEVQKNTSDFSSLFSQIIDEATKIKDEAKRAEVIKDKADAFDSILDELLGSSSFSV